MQTQSTGQLAYQLTDWHFIQSHEAANLAREILVNSAAPIGLPGLSRKIDANFWPTVIALIVQARALEAAALLASHPLANSSSFRNLRQLLNIMPITDSDGTFCGNGLLAALFIEFNRKLFFRSGETWKYSNQTESQEAWDYWQMQCSHMLQNENIISTNDDESHMALIAGILSGRQNIWRDPRIAAVVQPWFFRFTGWLFYTQRYSTNSSTLSDLLNQWQREFPKQSTGVDPECSPLDDVSVGTMNEPIFEISPLPIRLYCSSSLMRSSQPCLN